jgi:hypothetical protein
VPVINTTNVVQSLESVTINLGGSISVTVKTVIAGAPDSLKMYTITAEEALPHWAEFATPTKNRWDDLCDLLYQLLIERGDIAGTIS